MDKIESSILYLLDSRTQVRKVTMDGDEFLLTIPSLDLAIGLQNASLHDFTAEPDEDYSGYIAYNPQGSECIEYRYQYYKLAWVEPRETLEPLLLAKDERTEPDMVFVHRPGLKNLPAILAIRLVLIPLAKNGGWDRTLHESVPEYSLVSGGYLKIEDDAEPWNHTDIPRTLLFGDQNSHPADNTPANNISSINLVTSQLDIPPLRWRSFRDTLICTRKIAAIHTQDLYDFNILPRLNKPQHNKE